HQQGHADAARVGHADRVGVRRVQPAGRHREHPEQPEAAHGPCDEVERRIRMTTEVHVATATAGDTTPKAKGLLRQSLAYRRTWVGLVLTAFIVLLAVFGPFLAPYSSTEFVGAPFYAHTDKAFFGTDLIG